MSMQTSATNRRVRILLTGIRDKTLIPNPHFQRRLVWSNIHKIAFLETVLQGLPFPEIFISAGGVDSETGDGSELIVDGQQRITTLYQYFTSSLDLRLPNGMTPYTELDESEKLAFLEYQVVIRDLGQLTEDQTRNIFQRINSTKYSLNAMEVNNSRFDGDLKRFAEEIAADRFFEDHRVFTGLDGRRMNDVRFCLTLLITMMSGYFNRDDEHEAYLQHYNDELPQKAELRSRFDRVTRFIDEMDVPSRSRAWQKADLLTLMAELDRLLNLEDRALQAPQVGEALNDFYDQVESVTHNDVAPVATEYYRRVRSGINDRVSRVSRGEIVHDLLVNLENSLF